MTAPSPNPLSARAYAWWMALALLLIGAWLRLRGLSEMEFKRDEQEALRLGIELLTGHPWSSSAPWPTHGMPSSNHIGNAPLFTWLVAGAWAWLGHPVSLARAVAVINVLCLCPLWFWARRRMSETAALFTLAVAAASPFGVMFSRKIWGQDLLCVGVIMVLWGIEWLRGPRPWRGLSLLVLAALPLGQLHQSGPIALALLPLAIGIQWRVDRASGAGMKWGRPSPLEAAAVGLAVLIVLFFWIPYLHYLWQVPQDVWRLRPTLPSFSPELVFRVANQVIPTDLFYFFRPDRDDFLADVVRRRCFEASVFFGANLFVYGVWRWLRAPHALPVLGYWWLLIIAVFTIARIPTYPFYVLVLMPLPVVLAAGAFDGVLPRPQALALLTCRVGYVISLLALSVVMQSWLFARGGATGDYGTPYSVREAQARAIIALDRPTATIPDTRFTEIAAADRSTLECRSIPAEVRWMVNWLEGRPSGGPEPGTTLICSGFVGAEGSLVYRWFLKPNEK